jgi:ankyrin repeat protein
MDGVHVAASEGNEEVVKQLLENGADVEVKDSDGWTALHRAASEGHEEVIKLLS